MKTFILKILFALIAIIATEKTFAQAEINSEFGTRMNYVFGQLDKSRVPTGLLLDYAMEFASIGNYNGLLTDTNKTNAGMVKDIYITLLMSGIHSSAGTFVHPSIYDSLSFIALQKEVITLSGLLFKYNAIDPNAQANGKMQTVNGQLKDKYVGSVWQNPYKNLIPWPSAQALLITILLIAV